MAEIKDEIVKDLQRTLAQLSRRVERQAVQLSEKNAQIAELKRQSQNSCCLDDTIDGDNDGPTTKHRARGNTGYACLPDPSPTPRPLSNRRFAVNNGPENENTGSGSDVEMHDFDDIVSLSDTNTISRDGSVETHIQDHNDEDKASDWDIDDAYIVDSDDEASDGFEASENTIPHQRSNTPSQTPKRSSARQAESAIKSLYKEYHVLHARFRFKMIRSYPSAVDIEAWRSSELRNEMPRLWDLVKDMRESITEDYGVLWFEDMETLRNHGSKKRFCIARRFNSKITRWQKGDNGHYACTDCVASRRPCFTWTGEEFWLLPLRSEDRIGDPEQDRASIWI